MEEGESSKEEGEDGKYGKNGEEVRPGMAIRKADLARNKGGGGRQISHEMRSWGKAKGRWRRRSAAFSWRLGASIYITH
jgi:hypothetical protein